MDLQQHLLPSRLHYKKKKILGLLIINDDKLFKFKNFILNVLNVSLKVFSDACCLFTRVNTEEGLGNAYEEEYDSDKEQAKEEKHKCTFLHVDREFLVHHLFHEKQRVKKYLNVVLGVEGGKKGVKCVYGGGVCERVSKGCCCRNAFSEEDCLLFK